MTPSSGSISRRGVTTRQGRRVMGKGATPSLVAATRRAAAGIGVPSSAGGSVGSSCQPRTRWRRCMSAVFDRPYLLFIVTVVLQWGAAYAGDAIRRLWTTPAEEKRADFDLVRAATLTLLGLIIGFTFQMAISRYDQRKTYEREEANAIGTEYLRADLLPAGDADKVRALLAKYVQQRLLFYTVDDAASLARVDSETTNLENALWLTVTRAA